MVTCICSSVCFSLHCLNAGMYLEPLHLLLCHETWGMFAVGTSACVDD